MKVGFASLGWGDRPLPEIMESARAMGAECIEVNSRPGLHAGWVLAQDTIPQLRGWAEAAGLQISGLSGYNDFAQGDPERLEAEVQRLIGTCRLASELGVGVVRAFAGEPKPGLPPEQAWRSVVEGLQRAARLAQPLGVTLAIENHGLWINDGRALAGLVVQVGEPNVGITLDTGNFCWAGHSVADALMDFAASFAYTANVHVKDGVWRDGRFEFVTAGEGELPLAGIIKELTRRGYQGVIINEYEGEGDFVENSRRSLAFLQRQVEVAGRSADGRGRLLRRLTH